MIPQGRNIGPRSNQRNSAARAPAAPMARKVPWLVLEAAFLLVLVEALLELVEALLELVELGAGVLRTPEGVEVT